MIIVYPSHHVRHKPPHEVFNGALEPHAEIPERIEQIKTALESVESARFIAPRHFPRSWIEQVHAKDYIDFIAETSRHAGLSYQYPSVFPYRNIHIIENEAPRAESPRFLSNKIAQRGQYSFDMYTPIGVSTFQAAIQSAFSALTAASFVRRGERIVYSLSRPPGHHAEISKMGGYCYFNNAAIAANYLSKRGTVAVLDIDFHHGNGTQHIFYERRDVLVINIHATPKAMFPYFSGESEEKGIGKGLGFNHNYPLPLGIGDRQYSQALWAALECIIEFSPNYLVLSVGFDTHASDPIGGFQLTTRYFHHMAQRIKSLQLPTVLVQEGGYNTNKLGEVALAFYQGLAAS